MVVGWNEVKFNGVKKELGISESVVSIVVDGDDDDVLNVLMKCIVVVFIIVGLY